MKSRGQFFSFNKETEKESNKERTRKTKKGVERIWARM